MRYKKYRRITVNKNTAEQFSETLCFDTQMYVPELGLSEADALVMVNNWNRMSVGYQGGSGVVFVYYIDPSDAN